MQGFHFRMLFAAAALFALGGGATIAAADNFGAIAYSQTDGASGYSNQYPTREGAEERALEECGEGCQVVLWFENACGALAAGEGYGYGVGWTTSRSGAEELAMDNCRERTSDCKVVRWVCTER